MRVEGDIRRYKVDGCDVGVGVEGEKIRLLQVGISPVCTFDPKSLLYRIENMTRIMAKVRRIARERHVSLSTMKTLPLGDALRIDLRRTLCVLAQWTICASAPIAAGCSAARRLRLVRLRRGRRARFGAVRRAHAEAATVSHAHSARPRSSFGWSVI
jgi:hypothetical protein